MGWDVLGDVMGDVLGDVTEFAVSVRILSRTIRQSLGEHILTYTDRHI